MKKRIGIPIIIVFVGLCGLVGYGIYKNGVKTAETSKVVRNQSAESEGKSDKSRNPEESSSPSASSTPTNNMPGNPKDDKGNIVNPPEDFIRYWNGSKEGKAVVQAFELLTSNAISIKNSPVQSEADLQISQTYLDIFKIKGFGDLDISTRQAITYIYSNFTKVERVGLLRPLISRADWANQYNHNPSIYDTQIVQDEGLLKVTDSSGNVKYLNASVDGLVVMPKDGAYSMGANFKVLDIYSLDPSKVSKSQLNKDLAQFFVK